MSDDWRNEDYRELKKLVGGKSAPWYRADTRLKLITAVTKKDGPLRRQFIELVDYLRAQILADCPGDPLVTNEKVRMLLTANSLIYPAVEAILDIPRDRPNPNPNHQAMMRFFAAMAGDPRYAETLGLPEPRRPVNRWGTGQPTPEPSDTQTDLFG